MCENPLHLLYLQLHTLMTTSKAENVQSEHHATLQKHLHGRVVYY